MLYAYCYLNLYRICLSEGNRDDDKERKEEKTGGDGRENGGGKDGGGKTEEERWGKERQRWRQGGGKETETMRIGGERRKDGDSLLQRERDRGDVEHRRVFGPGVLRLDRVHHVAVPCQPHAVSASPTHATRATHSTPGPRARRAGC